MGRGGRCEDEPFAKVASQASVDVRTEGGVGEGSFGKS